ncbi:MAG: thioredoxin [Polaromonas sp.]|nr:thioredoxin [Polaromonas sp.]
MGWARAAPGAVTHALAPVRWMSAFSFFAMTEPTIVPAPPLAASGRWVVCLCAAWCGLCTDYRRVFSGVATAQGKHDGHLSASRFAWLDIEDQAHWVGDLDIETFPTLLVADEQGVLFMGTLTPHAQTLARLLASLHAPDALRTPHTDLTRLLLTQLPRHPEFQVPAG